MFRRFGSWVVKAWPLVLVFWLVALLGAKLFAPAWNSVATDGELRHLPGDSPSRLGAAMYEEAFPSDISDSSIVLVVHREGGQFSQADERFVVEELVPGLQRVAEGLGGVMRPQLTLKTIRRQAIAEAERLGVSPERLAEIGLDLDKAGHSASNVVGESTIEDFEAEELEEVDDGSGSTPAGRDSGTSPEAEEMPQVTAIASIGDFAVGPMLRSADGQATLVTLSLTSGFLKTQNIGVTEDISGYIEELRERDAVPDGLAISLTGSAMVGADTIEAVTESTRAVRMWAMWIAVALLLAVFRAPLAAIMPLATMYVAVEIAIALLAWAAFYGWIEVFEGLVLYVSVIVYGAGVDYSLFIVSRHQEEFVDGAVPKRAAVTSIASAGTAVAASAGTEIVGIGLLGMAEFGKFQQAGIGIALGLFVLLVASLTLTPALLCLAGKWMFWPSKFVSTPQKHRSEDNLITRSWRKLATLQAATPGRIWLGTICVLSPLAFFGIANINHQTYDLTSSLPEGSTSVAGMDVLSDHFSEGATGPATLILHDPNIDFSSQAGVDAIAELTSNLQQRSEELHIASIRSLADPIGTSARAKQIIELLESIAPSISFLGEGELVVADASELTEFEMIVQEMLRKQAFSQYVSTHPPYDNHVTWLTITSSVDPYASESIQELNALESAIDELMPSSMAGAEHYLIGVTASLRDVRDVARRDFARIAWMIPLGVLVVLMILLRKVIIPIYLIFTVLLTFFVTIGVTTLLFWALDPDGFTGLQWTVPVLLFVLLMAVGEDYSVLLVTRTDEEQQEHGQYSGITEALVSTGGLISGAGLIMAGTFSALAFGGTLEGMHQLGFALAFGMLLDTFVVRPLLVPSFQYLLLKWWPSGTSVRTPTNPEGGLAANRISETY